MSKPRELKHCFALIHKDAKKYEDWTIMGLPSPTGDDFDCVELREVTPESEAELAKLRKDYAELLKVKERLAIRLHSELSTLTAKVKRYEECLKYYADEMSYTVDSYEGISGEMRSRVVLYGDSDERNDVYSYAGRRARAALNQGEDK